MTESHDHNHTANPLGSIADEALKLLDAVQQRVGRELGKGLVKGSLSGFGSAFGAGGDSRAGDVWSEAVAEDPDGEEYICRACRVCRAIAAQREHGGDIADQLLAVGNELVTVFRQVVEGLQRREQDDAPREKVEHIDIG